MGARSMPDVLPHRRRQHHMDAVDHFDASRDSSMWTLIADFDA